MKATNPVTWLTMLMVLPVNVFANALTLQDYLNDVEANNHTVKASKETSGGLDKRKDEGKLIFRPTIFAEAQYGVDKKPTANVASQGDRTDFSYETIGLAQQFDFGLKTKLGYTLSHTELYNTSSSYVPMPEYSDSQIKLELSQSLWRNFYGSENKASFDLLDADVKSKQHTENYKIKSILSSAESVYWTLSQTQKILKVQKENLERANKIKVWAQNRAANGLGDRADLLQADANVRFREYELKTTEQQYKILARSFNSLRGVDSDNLTDTLDTVKTSFIKSLKLPSKAPLRDDTKAAIEYARLAKANANLSIEKNKPTFEVYGSYALNGRDTSTDNAISNSLKTNKTTTAVGIRFQAPLDFSQTSKNVDGYKQEQNSAELTVKQKMFDQDTEWNNLTDKFSNALINLELAEKIENAQKIKSDNERDRLSKGRTTTFQTLNFEQDYATSELTRIKAELEILNLYAQSKTFTEGESK